MKALTREVQENCANGKNYKKERNISTTLRQIDLKKREKRRKKKHKEPCCAFSISCTMLTCLYCCCDLTTWGHHIHRARCKSEDRLWTLIPSFLLVRSYTAMMISNKLCKQYVCCIFIIHMHDYFPSHLTPSNDSFFSLILFLWPIMRLLYIVVETFA